MPDREEAPSSGRPRLEEVEAALALDVEDRRPIPGLFRLNARRIPFLRLAAMQALLGFAALHNLFLDVGVPWSVFAVVVGVVEAYAVVQWWTLRRWFDRFERFHLGTAYLVVDLAVFSLVVWATGVGESLVWPLYLVRVGDQLWIGRRRSAVMAVLSVGSYVALLAFAVGVQGAPVDPATELLKVAVLVSCSIYLVAAARMPWDLQGRTHAAKDLILRLERQSEALAQARLRAEEVNRHKSEFLARMSHELRSPLTSGVRFADVLLERDDLPRDRVEDYLGRIRQNGMHVLALITDILDIVRIEEGDIDLDPADVDLEAVVRETVAQMRTRVEDSSVSLSVSFPRVLLPVRADEARLRQILINLVGNAIKFTHDGWVRVEVEADETGRPLRLAVVDTGVGIPEGRLEDVFAAFEQADGGTARRYGGTGIGLAISRALCRQMGFRLTVESTEGKGSTFSMVFAPDDDGGRPLVEDDPRRSADTANETATPGPRPG
ncbi:MAG: HAMP domain-containing sensor histidine kinase [Longimicrobiales bacterium]